MNNVTNASLFSNTSRLGTLIIGLLWFILYAVGFYRSAKKEKVKNSWLAWIPLLQFYLLGEIVQSKSKVKFTGILLFISQTLLAVYFLFLPLNLTNFLIYLVILIISYVLYQYSLNLLYKILDPDKSFLYLVLGILFPFLIPIWVYVLSKPKDEDYYYED